MTTLGNYGNLKSVATAQTSQTYSAALRGLINNSATPVSQHVVSRQSPTPSNPVDQHQHSFQKQGIMQSTDDATSCRGSSTDVV